MSEDILQALKKTVHPLTHRAADEIERLRTITEARLTLCNVYLSRADRADANLSEALRLMEPVAGAAEHYGRVFGVVNASLPLEDARAIADFVKRMKGEQT